MAARLAIYDMDRTITVRGTYSAFLVHMAYHVAPWRLAFLPIVPLIMLAYVVRLIDRARVKELNQALMIGRHVRRARLQPHIESYADKVVATNLRAGAKARIEQDLAEGYRLIMASASYRLYVEPIARRLGFSDVIATDHFIQNVDYVRSRIAGENCYDEAKLRMIRQWLEAQGIDRAGAHIRAYSDHVSDVPMLDFADEPVAANPHRPLEEVARSRGWPVVRW
jgi:HAD superfamily hydrolase (TIGR01490 family)